MLVCNYNKVERGEDKTKIERMVENNNPRGVHLVVFSKGLEIISVAYTLPSFPRFVSTDRIFLYDSAILCMYLLRRL